nr:gluconokinase [Allomuricauda sp.]
MQKNSTVFIIMGVSGTGKTTVGMLLAEKLKIPFFDGDDYHPKSNVSKMQQGIPLNDSDRKGWLIKLNSLAQEHKRLGAVIACSALKESYRTILKNEMENEMGFIFLEGSFELIRKRMEQRENHFMPIELLQSQFEALETPNNALTLSIQHSPEMLVSQILKKKK